MAQHSGILRVQGTDIVDGNGKTIILKGVGERVTICKAERLIYAVRHWRSSQVRTMIFLDCRPDLESYCEDSNRRRATICCRHRILTTSRNYGVLS